MANPIFEKSGTTTVTLSQAPDVTSPSPIRDRQSDIRAYNGNYKVLTRGVEDQIFNITFSDLPATDADALTTFFQSTVVNFKERPFLYTDSDSVQRQVRYLLSNLPGVPSGPTTRRVSMTLTLDRGEFD